MRLHDFFDYCVRANPNFAFAAMGDQTVTYGEASKQVNRLANALASAGIKKGDRVAFLSKNSIEYALMYYADARSGVVPVPLNYRLVPKEWAFIINDSQAKMLLESPEYLEAVDGIRPELETTSQYVSVGGLPRQAGRIYKSGSTPNLIRSPKPTSQPMTTFCRCIPVEPQATLRVWCSPIGP
jgi:acyl-CoA synthetase (AMP-forming)/AMP-acid ligase II